MLPPGVTNQDLTKRRTHTQWPAYPDYCFEQNIELISADSSSESTGTITRAELARHIAEAFSSFIQVKGLYSRRYEEVLTRLA